MKKLMGISVIAALAVLPMAANAELTARTVTAGDAATGGSTSALATTSYVQGAYNAANSQINALISDTAVAEKQGGYEAIESGATVGANLVALDEAVAELSSNTSTTVGDLSQLDDSFGTGNNKADTVEEALDSLDGRLDTLEGDDTTPGSVAKSIKDTVEGLDATVSQNAGTDGLALQVVEADGVITGITGSIAANTYQAYGDSTVSGTTNYLTAGNGVGTNLKALDTAVGKVAELEAGQSYNTGIASNKTVAQNLQALDTAIGNINTASGSLADNGNYIQKDNNVAQNLSVLDTQLKTDTDAIALLNNNSSTAGSVDYKVKENAEAADYTNTTSGLTAGTIGGAIDEISAKQIPVVSNWSTNAVTYTTIQQLGSGQS